MSGCRSGELAAIAAAAPEDNRGASGCVGTRSREEPVTAGVSGVRATAVSSDDGEAAPGGSGRGG